MEGIYCIEHISSGRKYYGSSMNVEKRLKQHQTDLQKQKHHNIQLQRAADKHRLENFKFYLVEETQFNNRKLLQNLEQIYIDKNVGGYNMAPANGGDTISNHPDNIIIRSKIRQANLLRNQCLSPKERKIKYSRPGRKNGMFGKTHSQEIKDLISKKHKGNTYNLGRVRSIEFKEKISKAMKGNLVGAKNPFFNKHHSEKTKQLLRESNGGDNSWIKGIDPSLLPYTKYYIITYPNRETKKVAGLKEIAREFNVSITNVYNTIRRMSQGKLPTRSVFAGHFIKEVD